jgi:hypothetical protein
VEDEWRCESTPVPPPNPGQLNREQKTEKKKLIKEKNRIDSL